MGNADKHRQLHDLFNGRDFDGVVKDLTDDFRYRDQPRDLTITGRDGFKEWLGGWSASMSNARVTDGRYLDAGDTSICLFTGQGTNDGQLGPFSPSGKDMSLPFCEVLTYDGDGNVTGGEIYYDQLTMLTQLGHLQAP